MGGNVVIGDDAADRIDLVKYSRKEVVAIIGDGLSKINQAFQKQHGLPLWNDKLFNSKSFLSGSSLHLFDLTGIGDDEFVAHKPLVGDIDTQVDGNNRAQIEDFLKKTSKGAKFDKITYLGYKPSGDQFISLWNIPSMGINVQVDLELVDFAHGQPTPWSTFSHSSAWEDIKVNVKGVFQKYLLRAMQAPGLKEVVIQPKTARGKKKVVKSNEFAFSLKGLRKKLQPVLDDKGKQVMEDGKPVYTELPSKGASFETNLDILFNLWFNKTGTSNEVKQMASFVGLIHLIRTHLKKGDQNKVLDGFTELLWGRTGQQLYRGEPQVDYNTKKVAFELFAKAIGKPNALKQKQPMIDGFYKAYK